MSGEDSRGGTDLAVLGLLVGLDRGVFAAAEPGLFGLLVGSMAIGAHLMADALTPAGIRPFAPQNNRHDTCVLVRATNQIANSLLLGIGLALVAIAEAATAVVTALG